MRLNADFNVSLAGLEAELAKALKPLENLLRTASGNKNAKVMFTESGTEFVGQSIQGMNQRFNLGMSQQDVQAYQALFARASAAKESMTEAIRSGNSAMAVTHMQDMSVAVNQLFTELGTVMRRVHTVRKDFTSAVTGLQTAVGNISKTSGGMVTGTAARDIVQQLGTLDTVLSQIDSKEASKLLGRKTDLTRAQVLLRNVQQLGVTTGPKGGHQVNAALVRQLSTQLSSTFKDLDELEKLLNTRLTNDAAALRQIQTQFQTARVGDMSQLVGDAGRSRGLKNALGTAQANSDANLQARAFSLLYGRNPQSPQDDKLFHNFIETLGPTVEEFQNQLYNVFSNTLGSLGAAVVFLTTAAIAKTAEDLTGLTKNLHVYENILESRGEEAKAQEISVLRKEMIALAGASEQTVTKLSQALVEISRLGGSTSGFSDLLNRTRVVYHQFGVDADGMLKQSQDVLIRQRRMSVDPGMLAEIVALAGPQAEKAVENFDKLLSSRAGLTLSYEQLRNAAVAYAKSGHEVSDSLAQVLEYVEKGVELYPRLAEEAEKAGQKMADSFLHASGREVFKAQQQVGAAIDEALLATFDSVGLGQGSNSILTMQTALLGLLTIVETVTRSGGEFLDWLNNLEVAGIAAGDLLRIAGALTAITLGLQAVLFLGKLVGSQLVATAGAWAALGTQGGAKTVLGTALQQAVERVSALRGGLSALGPILAMLGATLQLVFSPVGAAVVAVSALGALAMYHNQARKAEAAALDERTGRNLVQDERGQSRFREVNGSLTYALGNRAINVDRALAMLKNQDLSAAAIGITNADLEGAQDMRDLYQVVKRYQEARANFASTHAAELNNLNAQLTRAQEELRRITQELANTNDPRYQQLQALQAKAARGEATGGDIRLMGELRATMGRDTQRLEDLRVRAQNQVQRLLEQQRQLHRRGANNQIDPHMQVLIDAFKEIGPVLDRIKHFDDAMATIQLYQEFAVKRLKAEVDLTRLNRFEQQTQEAQTLVRVLTQALARETDPTRRQAFQEAIVEARDKIIDVQVARLREQFSLDASDIGTLPQGFTRLNESVRNQERLLANLQQAHRQAIASGASAERIRTLALDIDRAQNDLIQANTARTAFRLQLEQTRTQVMMGLENTLRPMTEFIADTNSNVYKLTTHVTDIMQRFRHATADEWTSVVPAVLKRFDTLFTVALDTDLDRQMVDDYIRRARRHRDETEGILALLSTFRVNRDGLRNNRSGLAYLVEQTSRIFFSSDGVIANLERIFEDAEKGLESLEESLAPRVDSKASAPLAQLSQSQQKIQSLGKILAKFDEELPAMQQAFERTRLKQLNEFYEELTNAENRLAAQLETLKGLQKDRVKNKDSIADTEAAIKSSQELIAKLRPMRAYFEARVRGAAAEYTEFVRRTQGQFEEQLQALARAQIQMAGRFHELLQRDSRATDRLIREAFAPLRSTRDSLRAGPVPLEERFQAVNELSQDLADRFSDSIKAWNELAAESWGGLDKTMADPERKSELHDEYRSLLAEYRKSAGNAPLQAKLRKQMDRLIERRIATLQWMQQTGKLTRERERELGFLLTEMLKKDHAAGERDKYARASRNLASQTQAELAAVRADHAKQQVEFHSAEAGKLRETLQDRAVGVLEEDLKFLNTFNIQSQRQLSQIQGWITVLQGDAAAQKEAPHLLAELRKQLEEATQAHRKEVQTFLTTRMETFLGDLQTATEAQNDSVLTEAQKAEARNKGLTSLRHLMTLRPLLAGSGLSERDLAEREKRMRDGIVAAAKLFGAEVGNQGVDLSSLDNLQEHIAREVLPRLRRIGIPQELIPELVKVLYGPEAVRGLEKSMEALEEMTEEELAKNIDTVLALEGDLSVLEASGLAPEFTERLRQRWAQLRARLEASLGSETMRKLREGVQPLEEQADLAMEDEEVAKAVESRLGILALLQEASMAPYADRDAVKELQKAEVARIRGLVGHAQFIPQALGKGLMELWEEQQGSPATRATALVEAALSALPQTASLSEEVRKALVDAALKPVLNSVVAEARRLAQLAVEGHELDRTRFETLLGTDPAAALQELSTAVAKFKQAAFQQVQAARTALDLAKTSAEKEEAQVNLEQAVVGYLTAYRGFLSETVDRLEKAFTEGLLTDAQYAQALKDLESLSVNPVLLVNQLRPLAEAIGMGEEELQKLVKGFLDLSQRLKKLREGLDTARLAILGDTRLTRGEREYRLQAAGVQAQLRQDTQNSQGDLDRAEALRGLVSAFLEFRTREFERGLGQHLPQEQRETEVENFRSQLISSLEGLDGAGLMQRLGLETSPEQARQFHQVLLAALKDFREDQKRNTDQLKTLLMDLLGQLQGMLQSFFMEVMSIPTRMMEESRVRESRAGELRTEQGLVTAQIAEYERLYAEAVKNYGAASEQAERYREKLVELRGEQRGLSEEFRANEESARSFFDYLLEAIANFLKAFANAIQQIIAQEMATRAVRWVVGAAFPGVSSTGVGEGSPAPVSQNPPAGTMVTGQSAGPNPVAAGVQVGSAALTNWAGAGLSSALGLAGTAGAFLGPLAVGMVVGLVANGVSSLVERYSDLEQNHRQAGVNRFEESPFDLSARRRVEVHLHGQYDRQKLADEAKQKVYQEMGRELLD
jgi:hypothetical protein